MNQIGTDLRGTLERLGLSDKLMAALEAQAPPREMPRTCPALRDDEEGCVDGSHPIRGTRNDYRRCRLLRYRSERKRLESQLALCGYPASMDEVATPIARSLWLGIDPTRSVAGLREELAKVAAFVRKGWNRPGHLALIGDTGTVKSHVLLSCYFGALWEGLSGTWITMAEIRQLAKDLESHTERTVHDAEYRLITWQRSKLLVIDDIGDRLTDQRARDGGSTRAAAVLLDLLNGHTGRRLFASNLDADKLRDHPDVGARQVSRLFSDHRAIVDKVEAVEPCTVISLYGEDQRQHQLRMRRSA